MPSLNCNVKIGVELGNVIFGGLAKCHSCDVIWIEHDQSFCKCGLNEFLIRANESNRENFFARLASQHVDRRSQLNRVIPT